MVQSNTIKSELEKHDQLFNTEFFKEYNRKSKSVLFAYLLWLFGFHYLYMGKYLNQIIFTLTLGGLGIWWLIDFVRLRLIINDYNKDVEMNTMMKLKIISLG